MTENRLPDQRDITTEGGNYNKCIEGNYIQDNKKVERHHNQAQTINNIENYYVSTPDTSIESNALEIPVNKKSETTSQAEAMFVITGKLCAGNKVQLKDQKQEIEAIVAHLQKRFNLDLTIHDITEGSVRIKLGGSQEDLERLSELFKSGELTDVLGIPVEKVELLLSQNSEVKEEIEEEKQYRLLIEAMKTEVPKGQNLRDDNFRPINLNDTDLREANLSGAYLYNTDLREANLSGAYLYNTDLRNANLSGANLREANLREANLSYAYLYNTDLREANLSYANLREANLSYANLRGVDLSYANLEIAYLRVADLIDADLTGANLWNTDLIDANLSNANLSNANLTEANFRGANLSDANVENTIFGYNLGISESMKRDLISRGAIFEDYPNEHSRILAPH